MIKFSNVYFSYGDKPVIENLSFTLENGKNLLITGPSGCGKTTIARLILGLDKPDSGTLTADKKISAVFQEDRLIEKLNVYKNICLPLNKEKTEFANKLISEFGLEDIRFEAIKSLSGGMKRRVSIIRALAFGGDALVLDEPFNGIDKENAMLISKIINREYTEKGKSVVIISHNISDAEVFRSEILKIKPKS